MRELVTGFRSIVLHLETEDVVPVLALADPPRGSSMLVNHADHCFWIGVSTADLVVNLRDAGDRLCVTRRGVRSGRSVILPTPLDVSESSASRAEVRGALAVPDDAVILLSVARPPKYDARGGPHFADLLVPVLQRCPKAHVLVAGPIEDDRWRSASCAVGVRIRARAPIRRLRTHGSRRRRHRFVSR